MFAAVVTIGGPVAFAVILGALLWPDVQEYWNRRQREKTEAHWRRNHDARVRAEMASDTDYRYDARELEALTDLQSRGIRAHGFQVPQKSGYFLLNPGDEMPDWPEEAA